jgi:hypothetical protein
MKLAKGMNKAAKKKVAFFFTLASLVGLIASPAAANEESWNLEVTVVDTGCAPNIVAPTWSPDPNITYINPNEVDLDTLDVASLVPFSVNLGLAQGSDNCTITPIDPTGDVVASFDDPEGVLTLDVLDCLASCSAFNLYQGNSPVGGTIGGTINASLATAVGTETGTLTVVWTPAG